MALQYELVNATKRERLSLSALPGRTKHDIAGNPAAAAIVAWYMMEHPRDRITFVTDDIADTNPAVTARRDAGRARERYRDVTVDVITTLVAAGILEEAWAGLCLTRRSRARGGFEPPERLEGNVSVGRNAVTRSGEFLK